ncbi:MAG: TolC family protein [Bacteroidaceae bacterium]
MKRILSTLAWLPVWAVLPVGSHKACAQDIEHVLASIEANNIQLQALQKKQEADRHQMKSESNLGETEIEYSPFYTSGVGGMASSELVVSQGFDFPSLYAARRKAQMAAYAQMDCEQLALKQDILLQARLLCLQIIYLRKCMAIEDQRMEALSRMEQLLNVKLENGEATIIEVNKLKIEKSGLEKTRLQTASSLQKARHALQALNGGKEVAFSRTDYPQQGEMEDDASVLTRYLANDAGLKATRLSVETAAGKVKVSKMENLPQLAVGYRRNTELKEVSNGFLVGASIPIFSNRHKTREARKRQEAAELDAAEKQSSTQSYVESLLEERNLLRTALATFSMSLTDSTLATLATATEEGQITAIGYWQEAEALYKSKSDYEECLYTLQCIEAMLRKSDR